MISSPTRMPPVSSAAFQVRPKSLRLIFVVAESRTRVFPQGSFAGRRRSFDREHNLARDAMDGQVAGYGQFVIAGPLHAVDLKVSVRKLFHIEEVRALQVRIALRHREY